MKPRPAVFLDASCWVAATLSREGGSRYILALAVRGRIEIFSTQRVILEALSAIGSKYGRDELETFFKLLLSTSPTVIEAVSAEEESCWSGITHEGDCHVLAGAVKSGAEVLVSLDAKHIVTDVVKSRLPVPVMNTREFLDWYLGWAE